MDLHPVFESLNMLQLRDENFDIELQRNSEQLTAVFFWGHDCPNCEVAKKMLYQNVDEVKPFALRWFHVNTYENFDLGVRFGLHGIPTFLFFITGKRLGKISPFPGLDPFIEALRELRKKYPNKDIL